jgi:hypothetical protein
MMILGGGSFHRLNLNGENHNNMEEKTEHKDEKAVTEKTVTGQETTNVVVVDYTAFSSRAEKVFFGRPVEQILLEIKDQCDTAVVHKTIEYHLAVINKIETKMDKPIEITSKHEENLLSLLKCRRYLLRVAKNVINERVSKKLIKRSDDLDDILMNDKLD